MACLIEITQDGFTGCLFNNLTKGKRNPIVHELECSAMENYICVVRVGVNDFDGRTTLDTLHVVRYGRAEAAVFFERCFPFSNPHVLAQATTLNALLSHCFISVQ